MDRLVPLVLRCVGIDGGGIHQLAGGIDHGDFHPGAQTRVETEGGAGTGGGGQQQVVEVLGEDLDRLLLGRLAQAGFKIGIQVGEDLHSPGPAHHLFQPAVGETALVTNLLL